MGQEPLLSESSDASSPRTRAPEGLPLAKEEESKYRSTLKWILKSGKEERPVMKRQPTPSRNHKSRVKETDILSQGTSGESLRGNSKIASAQRQVSSASKESREAKCMPKEVQINKIKREVPGKKKADEQLEAKVSKGRPSRPLKRTPGKSQSQTSLIKSEGVSGSEDNVSHEKLKENKREDAITNQRNRKSKYIKSKIKW